MQCLVPRVEIREQVSLRRQCWAQVAPISHHGRNIAGKITLRTAHAMKAGAADMPNQNMIRRAEDLSPLPFLTLDKSFVQACSADDLVARTAGYQLVIPEAQLYEIIKSEDKERARFFQKLESLPNKYTVAHSIIYALDAEERERKPYLHVHAAPRDYSLGKQLADRIFKLTATQEASQRKMFNAVESEARNILRLARQYLAEHQNLFQGNDAQRAALRQELEAEILSDAFVRRQYAIIAGTENNAGRAALTQLITGDWVTCRWIQVLFLFVLDTARR